MSTTPAPHHGTDPTAAPLPTPRVGKTLRLSARTMDWLAERPHARMVIRWVWNTLAELERTGYDPGAITALRVILLQHQPPTRTGRCPTCRRCNWRCLWRRRRFPCGVWFTIQLGLQGLFTGTGYHRTPDTPQPRTVAPSPSTHPLDAAAPGRRAGPSDGHDPDPVGRR